MDSNLNILRRTLERLTVGQLKKFKHHLKDLGKVPWGSLESSDSDDTIDLIVQAYTVKESDRVVLAILIRMNLNQLAMDMENELGKSDQNARFVTFHLISFNTVKSSNSISVSISFN